MTAGWRCFVAVPIHDELRAALRATAASWRARPDLDGLRWSDPASWHVTLAFLGSVDPAAISGIESSLREVAPRHRRLVVETGGLGAFPDPRRARVAWYGVQDPTAQLGALAADLAQGLDVPMTEPYRPHLTIARARAAPVDLRSWLASAADEAPRDRLEISAVELLRSHLGSGPARYERLAEVPLS
jgi:RNA 2',3'-cyclic 3'-phosphodiesterase